MRSKNLILTKFESVDFENYFRLVSNFQVMKMISGATLSKKQAKTKFNTLLELNKANPNLGYFTAALLHTSDFVGIGKLLMVDLDEAELGYSLLPEYWAKGFATEIAQELTKYALSFDYIRRLTAIIDPDNAASRKVLHKNGFSYAKTIDLEGLHSEIYTLELEKLRLKNQF